MLSNRDNLHGDVNHCAKFDVNTVKGQILAVVLISNLLLHVHLKICKIKTTAKGPHQENREILTPGN